MHRRSKLLKIIATIAALLLIAFVRTLWWLMRSGNLPVPRRLPDAPAPTTPSQ